MTFVRDYCFPALKPGAVYEGRYLLGTGWRGAHRRTAGGCALEHGRRRVAHGCTQGNDQVRFELTYMAAWRPNSRCWRRGADPAWTIRSREDALATPRSTASSPADVKDLYSRDGNLWHRRTRAACSRIRRMRREDMFRTHGGRAGDGRARARGRSASSRAADRARRTELDPVCGRS